jgi:hypothetical protein
MLFGKFTLSEIIKYTFIVFILKIIIYGIVDYLDNYKYPEEERKYKYINKYLNLYNNGVNYLSNMVGSGSNIEEGFQTYQQCRDLGYSKEFCVQTPVSLFGPAGCMCPNGQMGKVYPGLRGGCLCSNNVNQVYMDPQLTTHPGIMYF